MHNQNIISLVTDDKHPALKKSNVTVPCRYRSITKQFFRKADGVVVIYDITMEDSFRSVRPWLASILEAIGDPIPVMLLGNKSDKENEREVQYASRGVDVSCAPIHTVYPFKILILPNMLCFYITLFNTVSRD